MKKLTLLLIALSISVQGSWLFPTHREIAYRGGVTEYGSTIFFSIVFLVLLFIAFMVIWEAWHKPKEFQDLLDRGYQEKHILLKPFWFFSDDRTNLKLAYFAMKEREKVEAERKLEEERRIEAEKAERKRLKIIKMKQDALRDSPLSKLYDLTVGGDLTFNYIKVGSKYQIRCSSKPIKTVNNSSYFTIIYSEKLINCQSISAKIKRKFKSSINKKHLFIEDVLKLDIEV
ncbi:MAG: hypothetical protein DRQ78_13350 [Epsilonproteobacteria bacterium]|nr:MAG: hypothetical protein DRQ78_13350 [Campylobacterota bacterium]